MKGFILRDMILFNVILTLGFYFVIFCARYWESYFFSLPFLVTLGLIAGLLYYYNRIWKREGRLLRAGVIVGIHIGMTIPLIILSFFGIEKPDDLVPYYSTCDVVSDGYIIETVGGEDIYGEYTVRGEVYDFNFFVDKGAEISPTKAPFAEDIVFSYKGQYFAKIVDFPEYNDYEIGQTIELGVKPEFSKEIARLKGVTPLYEEDYHLSSLKTLGDYFIYIVLNGGIYLLATIIFTIMARGVNPDWIQEQKDYENIF